jgi:[acyl-carrier-protein] S-malonyltransferase
MQAAQEDFSAAVAAVPFAAPRHLLLSNTDGTLVTTADDVRRRLVLQLTRPVRWDLCLATLDELAPDLTVAVPPAKTLTAVLRRQLPQLDVAPITGPRDLAVVRRRVADRAARPATAHEPRGGLIRAGA